MKEPRTINVIFEQLLHYVGILLLDPIIFVKSSLIVRIARRLEAQATTRVD